MRGVAEGVSIEGWIASEDLDFTFVYGPFERGKVDGLARAGADVLDAAGKVIVRLPSYGGARDLLVPVETVPGAEPGFVRVVFRGPSIEARGLVRASDWRALDSGEGTMSGSGMGDGGGMFDTETATLQPGTLLFDRGGAAVGKMKQEATIYLQGPSAEDDPSRVRAWIHMTGLGFVTVYVRREDLRRAT